MAVGRPTVAFRTKENEITAGKAALYAENNNVDEFAELMLELANDPEKRTRMGKIGRERIESALAWSHQKNVLVQVYKNLFSGRLKEDGRVTSELNSQFCFNGNLAEALRKGLAEDLEKAKLSKSIRLYYRIRPFLTTFARQWFQKTRNKSLKLDANWYIPKPLNETLQSLSQPINSPWPESADFALVLTHDVETRRGFLQIPKLAEIEETLGFRSSWNIVPYKYKMDDGLIDEIKKRGHEFAIHGYNHDGRLFQSKEMFDSRVPMINRAIERYGAVGFRAPMVHRNLHWMQQLNIEYDASCFDVDPFQAMPGGVGGIWPFAVGKFIELPYTMPQDHTLFVSLGETSDRIWRDKLQFIQRHHGMALMLTHPDYLDSPSRLAVYRDFLLWLRDHSAHWHVLPRQISRWFRNRIEE